MALLGYPIGLFFLQGFVETRRLVVKEGGRFVGDAKVIFFFMTIVKLTMTMVMALARIMVMIMLILMIVVMDMRVTVIIWILMVGTRPCVPVL